MSFDSLKKLPAAAFSLWEAVFATAKEDYAESRAARIAWEAVKKRFKKVDDQWVARSSDFDLLSSVRYEFTPDEASVVRSEDGYSFIDYVMLSNGVHNDGLRFGPMALTSLIDQINSEGLVGRVGESLHDKWYGLVRSGLSPREIHKRLQALDTGVTAVKALMDNGLIKARIKVRNDLLDEVLAYPGVSIESWFPAQSLRNNIVTQARYQGFVFTDSPADPRAVRIDG